MQVPSPDTASDLQPFKIFLIVVSLILIACALAIVWNLIQSRRRHQARKAEIARQKLAVLQRAQSSKDA